MLDDHQQLSMFLSSPDSAEIIRNFNKVSGAERLSLVLHLRVLARDIPEALAKEAVKRGPLLSETLEGRVFERHLREQPDEMIAALEGLSLEAVGKIIRNQRKSSREPLALNDRTKTKPRRKHARLRTQAELKPLRDAVVALRLEPPGWMPHEIAEITGFAYWEVSAALQFARKRGIKIPAGPHAGAAATLMKGRTEARAARAASWRAEWAARAAVGAGPE